MISTSILFSLQNLSSGLSPFGTPASLFASLVYTSEWHVSPALTLNLLKATVAAQVYLSILLPLLFYGRPQLQRSLVFGCLCYSQWSITLIPPSSSLSSSCVSLGASIIGCQHHLSDSRLTQTCKHTSYSRHYPIQVVVIFHLLYYAQFVIFSGVISNLVV